MAEPSIIGMKVQTSVTKSGSMWIPNYHKDVDEARCIGCGECVMSCPRMILTLKQLSGQKICTIVDSDNCIGCSACQHACRDKAIICAPKKFK